MAHLGRRGDAHRGRTPRVVDVAFRPDIAAHDCQRGGARADRVHVASRIAREAKGWTAAMNEEAAEICWLHHGTMVSRARSHSRPVLRAAHDGDARARLVPGRTWLAGFRPR